MTEKGKLIWSLERWIDWMDDDAPVVALDVLAFLKNQPVKEQEEKTGHWIYKKYDDMFMCSSCEKYSVRNDYPYCHWCGAKMKQEGR